MPGVADQTAVKESRNLYAFGATSFFNDTASEMAYWVLPAFLVSIGAGPEKLGFIEGIAESVASFAKLFSGYLADRLERRKPIVVSGYVVANAVKPVLAVATSWWHVLVIRFSDRLAKGVRGAPRDVMLAESVEKTKVGAAFGLLQAMDSAGAIAGPLLALWILAHYSMRGVFWAAVVPGCARRVARTGVQHRLHLAFLAGRALERSAFQACDCGGGICRVRSRLLRLCERALDCGHMDHHGLLRAILCTDQPCVACAGGRNGVARIPGARFWDLLLRDQRSDASRKRHNRGVVETLRCVSSLLFLC